MSSNLRIEESCRTPAQAIMPVFNLKVELTRGLVWEEETPEGDFNYSIDIYVICEDGEEILWNCYEFSDKHPGYKTVKSACFAWVRDNRRDQLST